MRPRDVACECGLGWRPVLVTTGLVMVRRHCRGCRTLRLFVFRGGEFLGSPRLASDSEMAVYWALREVELTEGEVEALMGSMASVAS